MDITLERILSLIPRKPDGKYVHGAKKAFADKLGIPANLVTMWENKTSGSYVNYLYEISAKFGVSVEWLKGETDEKSPALAGEAMDAFTYAAHGYSGLLTEEDKAMVIKMMEMCAAANEGKKVNGQTDGGLQRP